MKKIKYFAAASVIILFSGFITRDSDLYFEINKSIDVFGRVYKEVALNYVDPINPEEFMIAGIEGMLTSLDPYTNFIDVYEQKDIDIVTKGKYGGIGATIGLRENQITIVDLIEGFSAQRQGLRIGDVITSINDTKIDKDNYDRLSEFLKGDPGTTVKIEILRESVQEKLVFNLLREEIEIKNITFYGFVPVDGSTGYVKLSGFTRNAGEELKKAVLDLKSQKEIKSFILDLRGNPGGLLDAAIDVSEKFLRKGQLVVSVKGRDSLSEKKYFAVEEPLIGDIPMIVLIDEGTASASEIVSGALQDHDRAVVVGNNSFGKGLVQTVIPLSYNTSLKITTARYYTPSGRLIQKIDYSEKNRVYEKTNGISKTQFLTDNKREVYSSGGIMPDSIVNSSTESLMIRKLLAEGMFFRFATIYFNNNPKNNFNMLIDSRLLKDFSDFLKKENFEFVSKSQKLIEQLEIAIKEEGNNSALIQMLKNEKVNSEKVYSKEIEKYKPEIVNLIREELAARTDGRKGRLLESLKFDKQLLISLDLFKNNEYKKFLMLTH